jgi:hypothetical protein
MNDPFALAVTRLNEGRLDDSEAIVRSLLQRNPETAVLWNFLGVVRFRKQDLERAIAPCCRH